MDEIVKEFLGESRENLDRLDRNLVELERSPRDQELLADIFRTIHSIKGTTGFLGFHRLESVAHAGENLLARLRDGALLLTPQIANGMLAMVDAIREMLALIEKTQTDGDQDYSELIRRITLLSTDALAGNASGSEPGEQAANDGKASPTATEASSSPGFEVENVKEVENAKKDLREEARTDSSIRVNTMLLDRLLNLAGELVLTRNQILQLAAGSSDKPDNKLAALSRRLNLVTTEMWAVIVKTRLQPMQNVVRRFPRMVRDLALACGKQVRLEITGQETELDRGILEAIKDPLTHALRNAVDHGTEKPEKRLALGKPIEGRLAVHIRHEGGQVNIDIIDDGAGIDPVTISRKAIALGLVTPEQAEGMSPQEMMSLIFRPGFSTAATVTNVSGRGVGMDVVKTNIERIGGAIDIQSTLGEGTTLRMKIPLTLAIIPALIVRTSERRFAIPQGSLVELLRFEPDQADTTVEAVGGASVFRLRGNLLPLLFLSQELHPVQQDLNSKLPASEHGLNIVVLQVGGQQFGLVVDEIHDTEEIVVKPLGRHLKQIPIFSGATVMSDGEVALILDPTGLARSAEMFTESSQPIQPQARSDKDQVQQLLVFQTAHGSRRAMPLEGVERLEKFKVSQLDHIGPRLVAQYRGELLPLVNASECLEKLCDNTQDVLLPVLVCKRGGQRVGIVVDRILDVTESAVCLDERWKDQASLGVAVVQQKVTDFLNLDALLDAALASALHISHPDHPEAPL